MKIYDCFMYYDEDLVLDLRLNILNKYVDQFIILESKFTHSGAKRKLLFDIKKYSKFKTKINYIVLENEPTNLEIIESKDSEDKINSKYIMNALKRENFQRNAISKGLTKANLNDLILISDVDEIPNLPNIDLKKINQKIILFKQDMFYYKFNLKLTNTEWIGTKACKKKHLISPQWLRNIKDRKYPIYRLDALFSDKKFIDVKIIKDGGWHFTNIKSAEEIEYKMKSYLHHREFDLEPIDVKGIKQIMKSKQAIYDLTADKRLNKIGSGSKLENFSLDYLPETIKLNLEKYKEWLD